MDMREQLAQQLEQLPGIANVVVHHQLRDAVVEALRADEWQPIETAPMDGSDFLLALEGWGVAVIGHGAPWPGNPKAISNDGPRDEMDENGHYLGGDVPVGWRPLPLPPGKMMPEVGLALEAFVHDAPVRGGVSDHPGGVEPGRVVTSAAVHAAGQSQGEREPITEVQLRGGSWWRASCRCGWHGEQRSEAHYADSDAVEHRCAPSPSAAGAEPAGECNCRWDMALGENLRCPVHGRSPSEQPAPDVAQGRGIEGWADRVSAVGRYDFEEEIPGYHPDPFWKRATLLIHDAPPPASESSDVAGEALLPCPFCGGEPYLHEPDFRGDHYQIGCRCGETEDDEELGAVWRDGKTFEEVAERWNLRAALRERSQQAPRVVCLCGSTRFPDAWIQAHREESLAGRIVLSVGVMIHAGAEPIREDSPKKRALDELHLRKIDLADEVLVLDVDGYIGESTRAEIEYAARTGKPLRYLSSEEELPIEFRGGEQ